MNSTEEILNFTRKMSKSKWKWYEQYEENVLTDSCVMKRKLNDAYYCNKELVMRLLFDAKVNLFLLEKSVSKN